jgi:peptide/nickel transport system substrate-binding protein
MFQFVMARPDPGFFMRQFVSWEIASKAKKWQGYNTSRWRSEDFDRLFTLARTELDPVKRATLFIKMNDLLIHNVAVIPIVWRAKATAISNTLTGTEQTAWDSDFWRLAYWQRAT